MKPWMIWLLAAIVVTVLARMKVGVHACYAEQCFSLKILLGRICINFGEKQKPEKEKKQKPTGSSSGKKRKLGWFEAVQNNWLEIISLLGRILSTPTLDVLRLQVNVGGKDPQACALTYGKICAVVGAFLAPLENTFRVIKRDISVNCCFEQEKIDVEGEVEVTLRIYEILTLAVAALRVGLKFYRDAKNNMKVV